MKPSLVFFKNCTSSDWQPQCMCACTSYLFFFFSLQHLGAQQPRAVSMSICVGWMTLWSPGLHLPGRYSGFTYHCLLAQAKAKNSSLTLPILDCVWIHSHEAYTEQKFSQKQTHKHFQENSFCYPPIPRVHAWIQHNLSQITHKQAIHLYHF